MVRRLVRAGAWLLVLLGLMLALLLVTLNTSIGHGFVKQALRHWVHPSVEVNGAMQLSVLPRLSMAANDLVVPDVKSDLPWLSIGEFRVDLSWRGLLSGGVTVNQWQISDITIRRTGRDWQPLLRQVGVQGALSTRSFEQRWQRLSAPDQAAWQLQIKELLVERLQLVQAKAADTDGVQPLISLDRMLLTANVQANPVPVGEVTVQAKGLRIEPAASETFHAALEQVGLGGDSAWVLERLQSRWQLSDGVARADTLWAVGPWGDLSSSAGSINLANGRTLLPLRVKLKGEVSLQTRGVQIRTRQSDISFVLSGPLNDLGIEAPIAKPAPAPAPVMMQQN